MKKLLFLSSLALTICASSSFAQTAQDKSYYGAPFIEQTALSPARVTWIMKDKEKVEKMQLTGYIGEVCQKEGCWIRLRTDKNVNDDILVKMKDHAFVLPKDIAGKRAVVNGTLVKKTQSVAEQQHYLEDAGASKAEIAAVTAPKVIYEMQATGVQVVK